MTLIQQYNTICYLKFFLLYSAKNKGRFLTFEKHILFSFTVALDDTDTTTQQFIFSKIVALFTLLIFYKIKLRQSF